LNNLKLELHIKASFWRTHAFGTAILAHYYLQITVHYLQLFSTIQLINNTTPAIYS